MDRCEVRDDVRDPGGEFNVRAKTGGADRADHAEGVGANERGEEEEFGAKGRDRARPGRMDLDTDARL